MSGRRLGRLAFVAAALLVTTASAAEDPAAPKPAAAAETSSIKPRGEVQLGERSRPTVQKKAQAKARQERDGRISLQIPERLRRVLERKIDQRIARNLAEAIQLRREAIQLLTRFVAESPPGGQDVADALMRLGELEWEDARDRFLADFRRWEEQPLEQRGEPPNPDYEKPRSRFRRVLLEHKGYRDYDLALYVDGVLANEQGLFEESLRRFDTILVWFPRSRFVPDAHMVRAEFEFTKDYPNYQVAFEEYEKVLSFRDSDLYDIALFKSAWCLWRLDRAAEAARRFLLVFQRTDEALARQRGKRRDEIDELQQEALRNLVAVFVEDEKNTADDMHRFLVSAGGDRFAARIVRALAEALYEQAHYERGIEAYRLLIRLTPTSAEAPQHALAVARGLSTMERWPALQKQYAEILRDYTVPRPVKGKPAPRVPPWAQVQRAAALRAAEMAIEEQLREDAVGLHAKAQRDKNSRAQFEGAAALYQTYLTRFDGTRAAYEVHFNVAEIYFYRLDDAVRAADHYLAAVRLDPKGKNSRDALYNALAALEQARAREFEEARTAGRPPSESPTDRKLTEAMELYIQTYPADPEVPELLFRQGKLYYDYQVYDPAVRQWGLLLEKYPKSKFAEGAGELLLDSFNKSSDYVNIETWARRLRTAPAFQRPEQQARLTSLIVQAVFKQGEQLSGQGKHGESAAAYLRAAREFPKEPRASQAAVNAIVEGRKAGDLEAVGAAATLLSENHRDRPEAAEGLWRAALAFQSVGLFAEAARWHATVAERYPKHEHHKDAGYNAVLLRTAIGEHALAIESGNLFRKQHPKDELADEVTFLMGKAHEKAEKWKEAEALYQSYARSARSPSAQVEAWVRLATVRVKLGDEKGASAALKGALDVHKQRKSQLDASGKYFAAKARYMQAERILAEFEAIKIEGSVAELKARLKKKGELLKRAADAFLATAEMGVAEWTTAALYQIGFTYETFTKALLTSPPPEALSAEERDLYKQQIEEFVIPIEERALEAYESGWKKALELGIFNSWTARIRASLARLNSELYPPLEEAGFELRSRGPSAMPALVEGPRRQKDNRSELYLVPLPKPKEATDPAPPAPRADGDADGKKKAGRGKESKPRLDDNPYGGPP